MSLIPESNAGFITFEHEFYLMKKVLFPILLLLSGSMAGQVANPYYQSIVAGVKYDSILTHLQHFESLGTKTPSSQALRNTCTWLESAYNAMGYTDVVRDTFSSGGNTLYNLIVSKTGSDYPNTWVILCGHYDSKNGPGTNDNGSGVSVILEVARLLQTVSTRYSVRFINFTGEESGYLGSDHYVTHSVIPANMDIRLVFNIDEVGGVAGSTNNMVTCEYDNSSPSSNNSVSQAFTDTLENLTLLYSALQTQQSYAYGSDYMPFQSNGEIITGFYESNESSYVHSSSDLLSHLDTSYVYEIARAACGAALYFAQAYQLVVNVPSSDSFIAGTFPNPFNDQVRFVLQFADNGQVQIFSADGRLVYESDFSSERFTCDLSTLNAGAYYYRITGSDGISASGSLLKY
jgi:hypothetical protein